MKIKNILYLFLLTNITVPYIFTMEEGPREQVTMQSDKNGHVILDADEYGYILLDAIKNHSINRVKQMLNERYIINVDMQDCNGQTPLIHAISLTYTIKESPWERSHNHPEIVQMLLDKGANPNLPDKFGKTALHHAVSIRPKPKVINMLLEKGANINLQCKSGWTALHIAAQGSKSKIVEILLQNGADPNLQDRYGRTALDLVGTYPESNKIIKILQDAAKNKSLNL